ncbi:MAG: glutamate synthase large subunit [Bacteroidales bacterium]
MQSETTFQQGLYSSENEHDSCGIGFVASIKGVPTHEIVKSGLEVLINMTHRGAESSDNQTGDGAGIMLQIPHRFFDNEMKDIPPAGKYGCGMIFFPKNPKVRKICEDLLYETIREEKLHLFATRNVSVNQNVLGEIASINEPVVKQIFITGDHEPDDMERKLYVIRKRTEKKVRNLGTDNKKYFYINSLSTRIIIYKGMFTPSQLADYYTDFHHPLFESAISVVHSRFSTNTFPTWDLAQPFRFVAHNGEINTIKGNRMWMQARESLLKTDLFGDDLKKVFPVVVPGRSDSASLDNVLEFLVLTGRSIPHALAMMIPESFNDKNPIPKSLKDFYEYFSTIMEPWDGPASLLFCDGRYVGGTLDRNGLRPSRYLITHNDLIVMGSETGVQSFEPQQIKLKGRLRPGKILLLDTKLGVIISDEEIKSQLSRMNPYGNWLKEHRLELENIKVKKRLPSSMGEKYTTWIKTFGYTKEDIDLIIKPMSVDGKEPTGSMGNDTPMAVLSDKPQRLFNYFKQQFAQVTNPAIDPIREGLVMSLTNYIGSVNKNLLDESPSLCKLIKFKSPIVTNTDLGKIKDLQYAGFSSVIMPITFQPGNGGNKALEKALDELCRKAEEAVDNAINYIILSDREIDKDHVPIPSLLAVATIHHHLIKTQKRMQVGLVLETAEPREVMHFALLLGYGASVINPYLSFAVIDDLVKKGDIQMEYKQARQNYIKALDNGILKVMSKMGISTLRSYHGAQIFECLGLAPEIVEKYFSGTASRIGGIGLEEIAQEVMVPHRNAFATLHENGSYMPKTEGFYAFRVNGEHHAWNPNSVGLLQWATKTGNYDKYKEYAQIVNEQNRKPAFLRGFLDIKKRTPVPLEEVEPIEHITRRFVTGAMSYGSISKEAHEALAIAMNYIGGRSNTGEGGEDPDRYYPLPNGENKRSAIKQVASGRFGVTADYLVNADEIQIKVAQGAKPGEGGQLPGFKVNDVIARLRNSTPGITLISPPPHHDIYSIEDLAQLIFDLKSTNPSAKISVKLVAEYGVGTVAAGVAKAKADLITISGIEGGTGASPVSSIKHAGLPIELGISEAHQTLVMNDLRGRVKLQTDGQLKTGRDVVLMAMLGAEEFGFSTAALINLGCIMMRKCHMNTCPVGVATQDENLRKRFLGKAEYVVNFFQFIARDVREILAENGFRKLEEVIGRPDLLEARKDVVQWKAKKVDISNMIFFPPESNKYALTFKQDQNHKIDDVLDLKLIEQAKIAIANRKKVWLSEKIKNTDRAVGAMLSGFIAKNVTHQKLEDDTIHARFYGSAGQSFGAFLTKGVFFSLEGDANDYLGKGLSGGNIIVTPPEGTTFVPEENIIIGNTVLYGATSGQLFVRGIAGERFAVRNSGANAVVEGVGDHGCEYMTGGRVVILGATGRNFAAGMSGGIAYVLDVYGDFEYFCNKGLVEISPLEELQDVNELQKLIGDHLLYTKSRLAEKILVNWNDYVKKFVKVIPLEYKKVLEEMKLADIKQKLELTEDAPQHQY